MELQNRTAEISEEVLTAKQNHLKELLSSYDRVAVAFSAGIDSAFLLKTAQEVLGERAVAVTAALHSVPEREIREAEEFCRENGIRHLICRMDETEIDGFAQNPKNRCYLCKKALFGRMKELASAEGITEIAEGSNKDDEGDYRPGMQAIAELGIHSPLREAGLSKQEIRLLSKKMGIPMWNKPSFACLSSRFVYGETITKEKLKMVERAEQLLFDLGFSQVRVRVHGTMARIELLPSQITRITQEEIRTRVDAELKQAGFSYVTVDLQGYRTGSMNETL